MGRPDYDDSVASESGIPDSEYVELIGDSTGSLTASGGQLGSGAAAEKGSDSGTP